MLSPIRLSALGAFVAMAALTVTPIGGDPATAAPAQGSAANFAQTDATPHADASDRISYVTFESRVSITVAAPNGRRVTLLAADRPVAASVSVDDAARFIIAVPAETTTYLVQETLPTGETDIGPLTVTGAADAVELAPPTNEPSGLHSDLATFTTTARPGSVIRVTDGSRDTVVVRMVGRSGVVQWSVPVADTARSEGWSVTQSLGAQSSSQSYATYVPQPTAETSWHGSESAIVRVSDTRTGFVIRDASGAVVTRSSSTQGTAFATVELPGSIERHFTISNVLGDDESSPVDLDVAPGADVLAAPTVAQYGPPNLPIVIAHGQPGAVVTVVGGSGGVRTGAFDEVGVFRINDVKRADILTVTQGVGADRSASLVHTVS